MPLPGVVEHIHVMVRSLALLLPLPLVWDAAGSADETRQHLEVCTSMRTGTSADAGALDGEPEPGTTALVSAPRAPPSSS